jgi:hypothetical protein
LVGLTLSHSTLGLTLSHATVVRVCSGLSLSSLIGFLILVPFFAFRVLGELVGERNLVQVFFIGRHTAKKRMGMG